MEHRGWLAASVGLMLSACAGAGLGGPAESRVYPPAVYAHRVGTSDVDVYWNCMRPEPTLVRFEGVVQNWKGDRVKFMELELDGADSRGKYVSGAKTALRDIVLYTNQISPYALQVRPTGNEERFDLIYWYYINQRLGESTRQQFLARDVCSPTQHRVPKPVN
ncbi:MAG TPA: hypothetical protein VLG48_08455 [Candidatus Methylomirabilis sp.]|nr:hypothetical protein [Candidatus Methylomirabilis sp.]